MKRRIKISHTLKFKLMACLMILVIPLIVILYLNNYYSIKLADQQMTDYTTRILDNYVMQLDSKMSNVSEYLLRMCLSDTENLNVDDRNDRYFYRKDLHEELQKVIGFYDIADGIFVYQQTYDEFAQYTKPTLSYGHSSRIGTFMQEHISEILAKDAQTWNTIRFEDNDYFVYTLTTGDAYIGAWASVNEIVDQIRELGMGELNFVRFASGQQTVFERFINGNEPVDEKKHYEVSSHLDSGDMDIIIDLKTVPVYEMLSSFQWIIIAASVIIVIMVIGYGFIYKKYIFTPMGAVEKAISQVEQGNWDYRMEGGSTSTEFDRVKDNFNSMSSEIHNLKIDIYEEEIHRQQVELEYLHYQIKPHFFLNVINTINSMAQIKEIGLIQKMTQYLSGYIRYTFRKERSMVTIKEELENVKNYLGMQLLRFPDSLECVMDMETRALEVLIPAMTMLTFVENIIKHAFDMYDCTKITLKAYVDPEENVHMIIKDSGIGFSQDAIAHIMNCEDIADGGKQVGVVNIKKRLHLIYGEKASVIASNDSGARIEVILPVESGIKQ